MWKKHCVTGLVLQHCLLVHTFTNGAIMQRRFSRGIVLGQTLRTFVGVPIVACEKECDRRKKCTHALFNRRASVCKLMSASEDPTPTISNRGMVLISKSSSQNENASLCGQTNCKKEETCTAQKTCEITECGPPTNLNNFKGNMYALNSSLYQSDDNLVTKVTCHEDGTWFTNYMYTCPPRWTLIHTSCYRVVYVCPSWDDAQEQCREFDAKAHLVYLETEREMRSIYIASEESKIKPKYAWLGGHTTDGVEWKWGNETVGFLYWGLGQPDYKPHRCLISKATIYEWADRTCHTSGLNGLCEVEIGPYTGV